MRKILRYIVSEDPENTVYSTRWVTLECGHKTYSGGNYTAWCFRCQETAKVTVKHVVRDIVEEFPDNRRGKARKVKLSCGHEKYSAGAYSARCHECRKPGKKGRPRK